MKIKSMKYMTQSMILDFRSYWPKLKKNPHTMENQLRLPIWSDFDWPAGTVGWVLKS